MAELLSIGAVYLLGHSDVFSQLSFIFEKYELDSESQQQDQYDNVISTDRHPPGKTRNTLRYAHTRQHILDLFDIIFTS